MYKETDQAGKKSHEWKVEETPGKTWKHTVSPCDSQIIF